MGVKPVDIGRHVEDYLVSVSESADDDGWALVDDPHKSMHVGPLSRIMVMRLVEYRGSDTSEKMLARVTDAGCKFLETRLLMLMLDDR